MTENNINVIKSITIHKCPHCEKEMFIENHMIPSVVASLFTAEDIKKAKEDCRIRIDTLSIDDGKKENVKKWLDDPNTIFAPNEVENIIKSLLEPEK